MNMEINKKMKYPITFPNSDFEKDTLDNIIRNLFYNNQKGLEYYEMSMFNYSIDNALAYLEHNDLITRVESRFYITPIGKTFARTHSFSDYQKALVIC